MQTKKTLEEIKKLDQLKLSELAELTDIRPSTLKYYTEIGLLQYEQEGARLTRRYDRKLTVSQLDKISKLKAKRLTIEEIKKQVINEV